MVDTKKVTEVANEMLLEQKAHTDKWKAIREAMTEEEQILFDNYYVAAITPNMTPEQREQCVQLRDWQSLDYDNTLADMKEEFAEFFPEGWED